MTVLSPMVCLAKQVEETREAGLGVQSCLHCSRARNGLTRLRNSCGRSFFNAMQCAAQDSPLETITGFTPVSPISYQAATNNTFTLAAAGGGSTSPVVFASTSPTICTTGGTNGVNGANGTNSATATILATGTCTLTANQAGDTN